MATLYSRIRTHDIGTHDYQNLTYFQKAQKLLDQQARWSLFISEFDIKL
jgi:hypothetical protein